MVQALVFAIGAVTRIFEFAAHFTVRLRRRDCLPFAAVANVRGKRCYLVFAVIASIVCRTGPTCPTSPTNLPLMLVCGNVSLPTPRLRERKNGL